jgi:hypothetical protein
MQKILEQGQFLFHTLPDIMPLALHVAQFFPQPNKAILGLHELMVNAIEHGNLGIGYEEKTRLIAEGMWREEVERRLAQPAYAHKRVRLEWLRSDGGIMACISDEGAGFDWQRYTMLAQDRVAHAHGRGIAIAHAAMLGQVEYVGIGNSVICRV